MKRSLLIPCAVLFGALLLFGACGDGDSDSSETPTDASGSPAETGGASSSATATPVSSVSLETPRENTGRDCSADPESGIGLISYLEFGGGSAVFAPGDDVPMTLVIRNCAGNTVTLNYSSGLKYDFSIQDPNGEEIWRLSETEDAPPSGPPMEQITPGQEIRYEATWGQTDSRGDAVGLGLYKVSAFSLGCAQADASECHFGPVELIQISEETS